MRPLSRALPAAFLAVVLTGCDAAPDLLGMPVVDPKHQAVHDLRVGRHLARVGEFDRFDRDGDGRVRFQEWVDENHRYALLADLDGDGALNRYEAMLYKEAPARRELYGQSAMDEFQAFWRAYQRQGRLRKAELTPAFRADFVAADADHDGVLTCREMFLPPSTCDQTLTGAEPAAPPA